MTVATTEGPATPPVSATTSRRGPDRRIVSNLLLLAPVVFLVAMGWVKRWVYEDAFLNFRIVDQIRAGHGPVFNIGERVETATSTAWLAILVVMRSILPFVEIEWISIGTGLALTGLGVWLAQLASRHLWSGTAGITTDVFVPFGALVYAVLPASWDWATSGLENGLSVAWIGATAFVLATYGVDRQHSGASRTIGSGLVVGVGVLVRPDLAVMSACAVVAVWAVKRRRRELARFTAAVLALPVGVGLFRAGYYGALVPNTALAKDANGTYWSDGWNYVLDFVEPYWLVVPLVIAGAVGVVAYRRASERPRIVVLLALPIGAVLHTLYVTKIGGDYIHARLLLPSLFAALTPVMALPWRRWMLVPGLALGAWVVAAGGWLRIEHRPEAFYRSNTVRLTADAPRFMRGLTLPGRDPILATDFAIDDGLVARRLQAEGARALVTRSATGKAPLRDATPDRTTLISIASGVSGYLAGVDVDVHEAQGLADPFGSRMPPISPSLAGHRKRESWEWMIAMTTRPGVTLGYDEREIRAARRALRCGAAASLGRATSAPLTAGRFWSNLTGAVGRTRLVLPRDPFAAERELCGPSR